MFCQLSVLNFIKFTARLVVCFDQFVLVKNNEINRGLYKPKLVNTFSYTLPRLVAKISLLHILR